MDLFFFLRECLLTIILLEKGLQDFFLYPLGLPQIINSRPLIPGLAARLLSILLSSIWIAPWAISPQYMNIGNSASLFSKYLILVYISILCAFSHLHPKGEENA